MSDKKSKNIGKRIMSIVNVLWIAATVLIAIGVVVWISVIVEVYDFCEPEFRVTYILCVILSALVIGVILYLKKLLYTGFGLMVEKTESMERMFEEMKKKEPLEKTASEEK